MKATETASSAQDQTVVPSHHQRYSYQKVLDGRKQPIRGLWVRNGRFLARITAEDASGTKTVKWVPLGSDRERVETVAQAKDALRRLLTKRDEGKLPVLKQTPKLADYVAEYFRHYEAVKDAKRPATLVKERGVLALWVEHMGGTRLDKINRAQINAFMAKRQAAGISGRTVNLDVIALRNVLKKGVDDGWLNTLPTQNLRPLKWTARKRALVTADDIDRLCTAGSAAKPDGAPVTRNAVEFADYIRLMAYCGARRNEALRLRWSDVDWTQRQMTIGSDGLTKNHEARVVDFNPALEQHLKGMFERRAPDSQFLFPSPQRGDHDRSAKSFKESLWLARKEAALPSFTFHDCRHHFISMCVMSGIDFMTIARWVGHKDGGVLIGRVYGHLADEHRKLMAQRVNFGPTVLPLPQAATA